MFSSSKRSNTDESTVTRHPGRLGVHPPQTCARVCVVWMRISITNHHTFDIHKSDSTCVNIGYRKSVSREG